MTYWPGTNIPKSQKNAFTLWREPGQSIVTKDRLWQMAEIGAQNAKKTDKVQIVISKKKR